MMKRFTTAASALALLVAGPASAQQTRWKQINSAVGGVLTGTMPNPGLASGSALTNLNAAPFTITQPETYSASPIYAHTPPNLYVNSATGSDSYDGLASTIGGGHGPFATLTKACQAIAQYDQAGKWQTIVVAAGTYQGCEMSGANRGGVGGNISGAYIVISGAGTSTVINDTLSRGFAFEISDGIDVLLQNVQIQVPANGDGLFVQNSAVGQIGPGVTFAGATGAIAIHEEAYGLAEVAAGETVTFTGSFVQINTTGVSGYLELDPGGGTLLCSTCSVSNEIFYLDANANVLIGPSWVFSGFNSIAGRSYNINGNSVLINRPGVNIPGSAGWRATGGMIEPMPEVSSVSGTGFGTGATYQIQHSTAQSGRILITAGTSPSAVGTLTVNFPEYLFANYNETNIQANCSANLGNGTGAWGSTPNVSVANVYDLQIVITWTNGVNFVATNLTAGQTYYITYGCR